tara:strand:+ start:679 stop:894 length:216 start_codon:yes stop_codon:yes gene_type:complete
MNTQQFFTLTREHDKTNRNNTLAQEELQYVTVAIKSQSPNQYQSLIKEFQNISDEVYAQQQCDTRNSKEQF